MFRIILKKEILNTLLSHEFLMTLGLSLALILGTLVIRAASYKSDVEAYYTSQAIYGSLARDYLTAKDLLLRGITVEKRPSPLGIFVEGVDEYFPKAHNISLSSGFLEKAEAGRQLVNVIFQSFDLVSIIQIVISLMAIFLTYDAICGEQERGTLGLVLSHPVPKRTVILGKICGAFITIAVPLALSFLVSLLILRVQFQVSFTPSEWGRLALIALFLISFTFVFLNIGILISALSSNSATSLISSLFVWAVLIFVVPNFGVLLATGIAKVPPSDVLRREKTDKLATAYHEWVQTYESYRAEYGMDKPIPPNLWNEWEVERDEKIRRANSSLEEQYQAKVQEQIRLAQSLSRLSPSFVFYSECAAIAGTDLDAWSDYITRLKQYKSDFVEYSRKKLPNDPFIPNPLSKVDVSDMPILTEAARPVSRALTGSVLDLALLALYSLVFFCGAYFSFLRRRIR